jgi:hypothetical protein
MSISHSLVSPAAKVNVSQRAAGNNVPVSWHYPEDDQDRDLRIDFIRGIVLFILVVVHVELFSFYNLIAWERIGVVSGAEGFVILTGYVTGLVSRRRIGTAGWKYSDRRLLSRAFQLWRVNVFAILFVALVSHLPWIKLSSLTSFTDRGANLIYPLYPAAATSVDLWIYDTALLRIGPHQLQVLGLYVCLLPMTPLFLRAMYRGHTLWLLVASWLVYTLNGIFHFTPTGGQFERAFPLLTWQVLFVNGLAIGYHRARVWKYMKGRQGKYIFGLAGVLFLLFLFWAQNTPNPLIPSYARISMIPANFYRNVYQRYMQKNLLGPLRLLDYACVLIVGYGVLTKMWYPISRSLGWFFVPLGQASLYVFTVHIYVLAIINNLVPFDLSSARLTTLLINTLWHTAALASLWLMVRYRILYRLIPR